MCLYNIDIITKSYAIRVKDLGTDKQIVDVCVNNPQLHSTSSPPRWQIIYPRGIAFSFPRSDNDGNAHKRLRYCDIYMFHREIEVMFPAGVHTFFFIGNSVAKASAWDFGQIFRLFSKIIDFSWIFCSEMNALIKRSHLNMFLWQVG